MKTKPKKKIEKKEIKTRIKNTRLIDLRRKQIIDGAMKVFIEKGYHDATVREIAKASGVTMGTLYNYIRSKQDIIYIVYDYINNVLREDMKRAIADVADTKEKLKAAVKENLRAVQQNQDIIMFLYKNSSSFDKESLYDVLSRETEYIELFEGLLREHFKEENVDETRLKLTADLLAYIPVIFTFRRWSLRRRFDSMDEVLDGILEFTMHGVDFLWPESEEVATGLKETMHEKTRKN